MMQGFRYPHSLTLAVMALFLFFGWSAEAQRQIFTINLSLGSRGVDVKELQRILNSSPETQVAQFGVGSKGQETEYFGILTKNAVISFQNKYKKEILDSLGLNFGTGFVGPNTLTKLNQMVLSPTASSVHQEIVRPKIFSISPLSGLEGTAITITGGGFTAEANTVHTIYDSIYNLFSSDGKTLVWKFEEPVIPISQEELDQYPKVALEDVKPIIDKNALQPIMFYIENKNGTSDIFIFTRTFK